MEVDGMGLDTGMKRDEPGARSIVKRHCAPTAADDDREPIVIGLVALFVNHGVWRPRNLLALLARSPHASPLRSEQHFAEST
jgi:hypothetical protein